MSRIEDLRRRLQQDPASIAFAQLAEEHRRAGEYAEAIRVCREGLARHPTYASARVTLARALAATGDLDAADAEFQTARRDSPDNLAAVRSLAELHQRRGRLREAFEAYRDARALAPRDPDLQAIVADLAQTLGIDLNADATTEDAADGELKHAGIEELKKKEAIERAQRTIARLEEWLAVVTRDRDAGPSPEA